MRERAALLASAAGPWRDDTGRVTIAFSSPVTTTSVRITPASFHHNYWDAATTPSPDGNLYSWGIMDVHFRRAQNVSCAVLD